MMDTERIRDLLKRRGKGDPESFEGTLQDVTVERQLADQVAPLVDALEVQRDETYYAQRKCLDARRQEEKTRAKLYRTEQELEEVRAALTRLITN